MYVPEIELHECDSIEQAAALMTRYGGEARLLAGGTDLLVDLKTQRLRTSHLVSLRRVAVLRGVTLEEGNGPRSAGAFVRIGALTTINELDAAPLVRRHCAPLRDATREMATDQVRNLATVGGNLASAVPCADLPPILIALGATAVIWSRAGERVIPLETFCVGPRQTALQQGELLVAVWVPAARAGFGAAYARFALREGNAIAVASVAAGLALADDGTISELRIVLGAVAPTPALVAKANTALIGRPADDGAFERAASIARQAASPISDIRGSAEYRRELVDVLTRRALAAAAQRVRENRT